VAHRSTKALCHDNGCWGMVFVIVVVLSDSRIDVIAFSSTSSSCADIIETRDPSKRSVATRV